MDINSLYQLVTEAIRRAEALEDLGAPTTADAHAEVSLLEEQIAKVLPANDTEGAIARRGAVSAAINAKQYERARQLADYYRGEPLADGPMRRHFAALKRSATTRENAVVPDRAQFHYPLAVAKHGLAEIKRVAGEFFSQGAPLPIR